MTTPRLQLPATLLVVLTAAACAGQPTPSDSPPAAAAACTPAMCSEQGHVAWRANQLDEAKTLYTQACDGDAAECVWLASIHYETGTEELAGPPASKACDVDVMRACHLLGNVRMRLEPRDFAEARQLFSKSCSAGEGLACNDLGVALAKGQLGNDPDPTGALPFLEQACELNVAFGCSNLARAHLKGDGTEVDEARALELFEQGCGLKSPLGSEQACEAAARLSAAQPN